MTPTLSESDEGKRVLDSEGEEVGMITEVRGKTAYVDPDPGLTDTIRSKLGWGSAADDSFPIQSDKVASITDDEVRLQTDM